MPQKGGAPGVGQGDDGGGWERAGHSWRVPSKRCYGSHFVFCPDLSLLHNFRSFLQNFLTSGLCYQCNSFSVASPIFLVLCCSNGLATLTVKHKIKQPEQSPSCCMAEVACPVLHFLASLPVVDGFRSTHLFGVLIFLTHPHIGSFCGIHSAPTTVQMT
jgi:hypothetical protein